MTTITAPRPRRVVARALGPTERPQVLDTLRAAGDRPHVSHDNPYSEAQFKTMKYRPDFPERFGSIEDARAHGADFFPWYNTAHRHVGLGLHTPRDVHVGLAEARRGARRTQPATGGFLVFPCASASERPIPR